MLISSSFKHLESVVTRSEKVTYDTYPQVIRVNTTCSIQVIHGDSPHVAVWKHYKPVQDAVVTIEKNNTWGLYRGLYSNTFWYLTLDAPVYHPIHHQWIYGYYFTSLD
jgi:ABC-type Fe3+-citrate transport system substrate-binding protein